jgi:hypothetical protein
LIESKFQISLLASIARDFGVQFLVSLHRREEADMLFEHGKVNQVAHQSEGWHLIADLLLPWGAASLMVRRIFSRIAWTSGEKDAMYSSMFLGCNR